MTQAGNLYRLGAPSTFCSERFHDLSRRQIREQLSDRPAQHRMTPSRQNIRQRAQYKKPLVQAGVGYDQAAIVHSRLPAAPADNLLVKG
jgi:hypothetical protein